MTDYLWEKKECEEQKERFMSHRKNSVLFRSKEEQDRRLYLKKKQVYKSLLCFIFITIQSEYNISHIFPSESRPTYRYEHLQTNDFCFYACF